MASRDWYGFYTYVPMHQRRASAAREAVRLKKQGRVLEPLKIEGRTIARTVWGKAWCEHFEGLGDYASRLPRGRTYARNGSVIDLKIETGRLTALVSGSELYELTIAITPMEKKKWQAVVRSCAGKIDSVVELLAGELSEAVMGELCHRERGLFPSGPQLQLSCSCPDGAWLCKHLAAVLYGVGNRLDQQPELLFVLRGVDQMDLISEAAAGKVLGKKRAKKGELDRDELAGIFGIELDDVKPPAVKRRRKS